MSTVLGIETATSRLSVALGRGGGLVASVSIDGERRHVEELAPTIRRLCTWAGIPLPDIDAVAVDVGPGLFTGMRVGIATAQGLALALGVEVFAIRSIDVIAHPLRHSDRPVVVVVDARRGEVFRAIARAGEIIVEPTCTSPHVVATEIGLLGACLVVGDGAVRYRTTFEAAGAVEILAGPPSAEALIDLAMSSDRPTVDPSLLAALYLREADAKANFEVAR